jgi:hypothetical protein
MDYRKGLISGNVVNCVRGGELLLTEWITDCMLLKDGGAIAYGSWPFGVQLHPSIPPAILRVKYPYNGPWAGYSIHT